MLGRQRMVPYGGGGLAAGALRACAPQAPQGSLPAVGEVDPIRVADFPGYTEGIAFDATGIGYVSAGRNPQDPHAVYRLLPGKPPERWLELHIPNGHKVLTDGSHVIAAEGTIVRVARDGRILDSLAADRYGAALQRPNDIALDGHGGFYFTDPGVYQPESRHGRLLYVDSSWSVTPAADRFCYAADPHRASRGALERTVGVMLSLPTLVGWAELGGLGWALEGRTAGRAADAGEPPETVWVVVLRSTSAVAEIPLRPPALGALLTARWWVLEGASEGVKSEDVVATQDAVAALAQLGTGPMSGLSPAGRGGRRRREARRRSLAYLPTKVGDGAEGAAA